MGFAALMVRVPLVVVAVPAAPSLMSRHGAQPPWHDLGSRTSGTWHHLAGENPWRTALIVLAALFAADAVTAVAGPTTGVAVGAALGFRLLTFWCRIPLGLASFAYLNHRRAI